MNLPIHLSILVTQLENNLSQSSANGNLLFMDLGTLYAGER
jgi:hypothetical protein